MKMAMSSSGNRHFDLAEWNRVARTADLSPDQLVFVKQTHSNRIIYVDSAGYMGEFDGLITNRRHVILSIRVADCVPIFFYAPDSEAIALIHAGWKGTVEGIAERTVRELVNRFGSKSESIEVFMGPSIRSCCYRIQKDVAKLFSDKYIKRDKKDGYYLDLQKSNRFQLKSCSVRDINIKIDNRCTFCSSEGFFSFRRDGHQAGRMLCLMSLS